MNNMMGGTSIQQLQNNENMEMYENFRQQQQPQYLPSDQPPQQYGAIYQQQQVLQQPQGPTCPLAPQQPQMLSPQQQSIDMGHLARDISDNLPEEYTVDESENNEKCKNGGLIPCSFHEPLVIIALYVLLSQSQVKNIIGKYINQVLPDPTGNVSLFGTIIYGLILAILFSLTKRFVLE